MTAFKPMLAKDAPEDLSTLSYPLIAQPKLDGIRCSIVDGRPVTRTLKDVPNREIRDALSDPRLNGLDGELIVGSPTDEGCMQRTTSFVMAHDKTGEPWAYHVFDAWDLGDDAPFWTRYAVVLSRGSTHPSVLPVVPVSVFSRADLESLEDEHLEQGWEGLILRDPTAPYKFGRSGKSGPLLKLKRFSDSEAVVLGCYEEQANENEAKTNALGRTERSSHKDGKIGKGTLGGFEVRDLQSGVEFRIGTGFTASQRADLWERRGDLVGSLVKYKFFPVGVKDRPRHPVWLGFRSPIDL